jgi:hypothetical protein
MSNAEKDHGEHSVTGVVQTEAQEARNSTLVRVTFNQYNAEWMTR